MAFPFGHGLSFTTFTYDNPHISAETIKDIDGVTVSVDVTNTGPVDGKEIVQVYVHDRQSRLVRPYKELKGFAKVSLEPGETKTVSIPLDFRAFAYYDPAYKQWITEEGEFDILIGASATDIRGRVTVTLQSTLQLPTILHEESTVRSWLNDPVGKPIFQPFFEELLKLGGPLGDGASGPDAIGHDATGPDAIGMDFLNFLMDLPLRSFLDFQEGSLSQPPDEAISSLLQQVYRA